MKMAMTRQRLPVLMTEHLLLRPFEPGDEESLFQALKDGRIAKRLTHIPSPYTLEHASRWVVCASADPSRMDFAIVLRNEPAKVVGSVAFIKIEELKAQVSYWRTSTPEVRWRMSEAVREIVRYGFQELRLLRIYGYIFQENERSRDVLLQSGFHFEGVNELEWPRVKKRIDPNSGKEVEFLEVFDSHRYAITWTRWYAKRCETTLEDARKTYGFEIGKID